MSGNSKKDFPESTPKHYPDSGHPSPVRRIDSKYLIHEIYSVISFEKGFFFTIRELITRPGRSVAVFLREDRSRLVKPILFLILTSLIYTILNRIFQFEAAYSIDADYGDSASVTIANWIQGNYGYTNIIMAFFIAACTKLFFRKHDTNIFEILVLLSFIMGIGMLIYGVFGVLQSLFGYKLLQVSAVIGFIYFSWAIGEFYGSRKFINYVKAFFAYILGMVFFSVTTILIGKLLDFLAT